MPFPNVLSFMACGTSNMTLPEKTVGQKYVKFTDNKERWMDKEMEPSLDNGRNSVSATTKGNKDLAEKKDVLKEMNSGETNAREDSILLSSPGSPSPSFRVYCHHHNDSLNSQFRHEQDKYGEENDLKKNGEEMEDKAPNAISKKGSESQPVKIWRKTRGFRSVMQRGGAVGMKNFLNISCRSRNPSTSH